MCQCARTALNGLLPRTDVPQGRAVRAPWPPARGLQASSGHQALASDPDGPLLALSMEVFTALCLTLFEENA